jgi:hypothetical protein
VSRDPQIIAADGFVFGLEHRGDLAVLQGGFGARLL